MSSELSTDLAANYAQGQFAGRLPWGRRAALIVIDFCIAYLEPGSPLYAAAEPARDATARLLGAARASGVPVLHTEVRYQPGGLDGGVFYRKVPALRCFEAGSRLAAPPPELAPLPGETIVTKQYASAFFGTSLASTLTALGVDTVVLTGVSTSGCVRATAVDACQHGFLPFVCRDAVGDRHPAPHEANLFDLQAKYAEVVSEAFVLERFAAIGKAAA
ncbi:isochorismatase family protein [Roseomonas sp. NAR14]|uniref:Isochorismatase family protein n=1 Tax=Roseomonas acroporae TaxID=2937791 RepID=A0A9X2BUT8_9PROT|nr:isochorismatase family protein [Roseomonas acroporae]MCK8784451.1 isochorismatase family protein [Roseomonas acroporae]